MSGATYPVGAMAVIRTPEGSGDERSVRSNHRGWYTPYGHWHESQVTVVRPLVVLDLVNAPTTEDVGRVLREGGFGNFARQIEAQTRPPKPAEPTGLGAVVEDREGDLWLRYTDPGINAIWQQIGGGPYRAYNVWADIDVVKVLSEGWTP